MRARPSTPLRRYLAPVAVLGALAAAVLAGLPRVDVAGAAGALGHADPELLGVALGLYLLSQTLSGAMWGVCQAAGGVGVPMGTTIGLHWITRAACELMPLGLGEAVRVGVVRRHPGGSRAGTWRVAGGLAAFKVVDGAVTAVVVLVIVLATPLPGPLAGLRWSAAAAVAAMVVLAVAGRLGGWRARALLPVRARDGATRLGEGAAVLGRPAPARLAAGLGLAAALARIASLGALLAALGLAPHAAPLAYAAIVLAGIVPGAPGGAGAREVVLLPALAAVHGVGAAPALAFSLAVQATALGTSLLAGGLALAWLGPALLAGRRAAGEAAPAPAAGTLPAAAYQRPGSR
jgi:glycosyltransferase 2 family protein